MFDIDKFCKEKKECAKVDYLKKSTGGNDPSISQKMRYAEYLRTNKSKQVVQYAAPSTTVVDKKLNITTVIPRYQGYGYTALADTGKFKVYVPSTTN